MTLIQKINSRNAVIVNEQYKQVTACKDIPRRDLYGGQFHQVFLETAFRPQYQYK